LPALRPAREVPFSGFRDGAQRPSGPKEGTMWAQWLERILNAHDAAAYAGRRAAGDEALPLVGSEQSQETSREGEARERMRSEDG
jgi:hypothetical protein